MIAETTITPDPIACVAVSVGEYPQDVSLLREPGFLPDDWPAVRITRFKPTIRHANPCIIGARAEPGMILKKCGTVNQHHPRAAVGLHAQSTPPGCVSFIFGGLPSDLPPIESGVVSQTHTAGVGYIVLEDQKWNATFDFAPAPYLHRLNCELAPR